MQGSWENVFDKFDEILTSRHTSRWKVEHDRVCVCVYVCCKYVGRAVVGPSFPLSPAIVAAVLGVGPDGRLE